ncbi:RNase adapter protein RapZ [hydrothermal vent metagenome]|uniref:RNase adapter protein RapZ n=1 Tax=hydrothermal vent metagenome TaxID=652676 RepID=A0A3B1AZ66_9ZZZZ
MNKFKDKPLKLYLITGMSGAGKSSVLKILEDLNYEAIDNLPVTLLSNVLELVLADYEDDDHPALVIGIDARTRNFQQEKILENLSDLKSHKNIDLQILYFDSRDEILVKRFSETRRKHPLAKDRQVIDGITQERQMMQIIRAEADYIFDTSDMEGQDLRQTLTQKFERQHSGDMNIVISSFAYPKGLPRNADLVFDVRFLRNPHYVDELKLLTGLDGEIQKYVEQDERFADFYGRISDLILFLLPEYKKEGKSYLKISFGCTGGRHRSVCVAEKIAKQLNEDGLKANIYHRELVLRGT